MFTIAPLLATAALAAPGAGTAGPSAPDRTDSVEDGSFHSDALQGTVHYAVSLPHDYFQSPSTRYSVVYFLHGLPAGPSEYRTIGWIASALRRSGHEAIVVGPQGARNGDSDPEWLNWGKGRNWEAAVERELVPTIDSRYRTIASRSGRVLIGVSAGGYGAALIGYHHPGTFSSIQSWSGYFQPTSPDGSKVLDLGSKKANDRASLHALVPKLRKRLGQYYERTYFGFFIGAGDTRFLPDNRRLASEMKSSKIPNTRFRTYQGEHSMDLWQEHASAWIARALDDAASAGG
jgi:enterochelin esterase-like enzyme